MTRDADIARIAAVLNEVRVHHPAPQAAAALYYAGLRPSVEPAGLDVERLARAIAAVGQSYMDQKVREWEPDWIALRIAAEYAALPPEASDSPEKTT